MDDAGRMATVPSSTICAFAVGDLRTAEPGGRRLSQPAGARRGRRLRARSAAALLGGSGHDRVSLPDHRRCPGRPRPDRTRPSSAGASSSIRSCAAIWKRTPPCSARSGIAATPPSTSTRPQYQTSAAAPLARSGCGLGQHLRRRRLVQRRIDRASFSATPTTMLAEGPQFHRRSTPRAPDALAGVYDRDLRLATRLRAGAGALRLLAAPARHPALADGGCGGGAGDAEHAQTTPGSSPTSASNTFSWGGSSRRGQYMAQARRSRSSTSATMLADLAYVYTDLGTSYRILDEPRQALEYFTAAFTCVAQLGDQHGLATAYMNLGSAYFSLNQPERALGEHRARAAHRPARRRQAPARQHLQQCRSRAGNVWNATTRRSKPMSTR
jgi:hypothetical protein